MQCPTVSGKYLAITSAAFIALSLLALGPQVPVWAGGGGAGSKLAEAGRTAKAMDMEPLDAPALAALKEEPKVERLAAYTASIGAKLYDMERQSESGNILFSPFSIESALTMVAFGAKGTTLNEILDLQDKSNDNGDLPKLDLDLLKDAHKAAVPAFVSTDNFTVSVANLLASQANSDLLPTFKDDLAEYMHTESLQTDFGDAKSAADLINGWVEERTREKIKNMLSEESLQSATLVLANALYFKGKWAYKFDKRKTERQDFSVTEEKKVKADFMWMKAHLPVAFFKELTIIGMPYAGDRFTLYLVAPRASVNTYAFNYGDDSKRIDPLLADIEQLVIDKSSEFNAALNLDRLHKQEVELTLPRFKIELSMNLRDKLVKLGLENMFEAGKADLSGINGGKDLFVSDVVHKAFIEVNERGTEAAAASAVIVTNRSMPPPPIKAIFDKPFLFVLKDEVTGIPLFQGRVADPTA